MYDLINHFKPLYVDRAINKADGLFNVRQEVKFLIPKRCLSMLLSFLRQGFYSRSCKDGLLFKYCNTYLDTSDLMLFHRHRQGKYNRLKVRIREYKNGIPACFIECKEKHCGIKNKKKRKVLNKGDDYLSQLKEPFLKTVLDRYSVDPNHLVPSIQIQYDRLHFISPLNQVRVTLDFNLMANLPDEKPIHFLSDFFILEIKFNKNPRDILYFLRQDFNLRPLSFSKYCVSLCYLNESLKRNRWKQIFKKYIDV